MGNLVMRPAREARVCGFDYHSLRPSHYTTFWVLKYITPFDILDPVTLIGVLVTLGATAIQLFRGR